MSAFRKEDKKYFYGRESFTKKLVQVTHQQSLVPIIAPSGSGKSSIVFAGLIPELESEGAWLIESFRPRSQPFNGLVSALVRLLTPESDKIKQIDSADKLLVDMKQGDSKLLLAITNILEHHPGKRLLLVIDQFEELYSQCSDNEEQRRFVDALLKVIESFSHDVSIVLTLRADFYNYVLNYPPFAEAIQKNPQQVLSIMNSEEMKKAIEEPAKKIGVELQEGLTERILNDVKQEPGDLPLLEFALTELWKKQDKGKLTHKAYVDIGTVKEALTNHADEVYNNLNDTQKKQLPRVLLKLVRPGLNTKDTRRLATREEVDDWDLISILAGEKARLVVTGCDEQTGNETVEIAHEALIQEWKLLREWIEKDRLFLHWLERLRAHKYQWDVSGKDNGALLRGVLLTEAERWQQERLEDISPSERHFIESSVKHKNEEIKMQEIQRQRITIAQTVAGCLLFVLTGLIVFFNRDNIRLTYITMNKKNLAGSNLAKSYFPGANLSGASLNRAILRESDLSKANLSAANLKGVDFWKSYMTQAQLQKAELQQANLEEAHLMQAQLQSADLTNADLFKANLQEANLSGAKLNATRFLSVHMPKAQLQNTDLTSANMNEANLERANLSGANLNKARFIKTFMLETNLEGADLSGADFREAQNLKPEQVKRAKNWEKANYDKEFRFKLGLQLSKNNE